jgi:LmbE family N-acetylglucosaminyl deacetylase
MSVWAHYDDDLLFLGTPIQDAMASGQCVRTVFLTAGDAGRGAGYSAGREQGIMKAYDTMRGASGPWVRSELAAGGAAPVPVWQPSDDPRLSLVFLALPDGNLTGLGFPGTGEVSLAKLAAGKIPGIADLAGTRQYTWDQLRDQVAALIADGAPTVLYTHMPGSAQEWARGDHADHAVTGVLVREAWQQAGLDRAAVHYAVGYQTAERAPNVSGEELAQKIAAFRAYASDDAVTAGCRDDASCLALPRFGAWLQRQYLLTDPELFG